MTHTLWDLVPHIILHQDPSGYGWHTNPKVCRHLEEHKGKLTEKTLKGVLKEGGHINSLCNSRECNKVLAVGDVKPLGHLVSSTNQLNDTTRHQNLQVALSDLAHAQLHQSDVAHLIKQVRPDLQEATRLAQEEHTLALATRIKAMREPGWRSILLDHLDAETSRKKARSVLGAAQLGDISDMGLLVGPHDKAGDLTWGNTYLSILSEEGHGTNKVVKAPLGVLSHLTDRLDDTKGYLGWRRQMVNMPPDLTPEMEEVISGLYDPDNEGLMSELPHVVEAARKILKK